jgi:hypothetical protein
MVGAVGDLLLTGISWCALRRCTRIGGSWSGDCQARSLVGGWEVGLGGSWCSCELSVPKHWRTSSASATSFAATVRGAAPSKLSGDVADQGCRKVGGPCMRSIGERARVPGTPVRARTISIVY